MHLIRENDQIERIFLPWRLPLGKAYEAYKGHVYRVLNFTCALIEQEDGDLDSYGKSQKVEDRVAIAACFHDVGIWRDKTMHYLEPSKAHATHYLQGRSLTAWEQEILLMIEWHHKLSAHTGDHTNLVEAFRRADLVEVHWLASQWTSQKFHPGSQKGFP